MMWQGAAEVAETGLRDVAAGRALSIPGMVNKGMVAASGMTPRNLLRRITGIVRV